MTKPEYLHFGYDIRCDRGLVSMEEENLIVLSNSDKDNPV